jgi:hypothetical protein
MPDVVTITPRKIYLEDLATTSNASGETASVTVAGEASNPQTLNKIALLLLTDLTQAANDAAAAAAGVAVGQVYYNTTNSAPHARQS